MAKKLTPEKLQELMQVAAIQARTVSADSEGAVDGNVVYLETLVDGINEFFLDQQTRQMNYSIALQRAIEYHCKNMAIPDEVVKECPHHAEMLNKQ